MHPVGQDPADIQVAEACNVEAEILA